MEDTEKECGETQDGLRRSAISATHRYSDEPERSLMLASSVHHIIYFIVQMKATPTDIKELLGRVCSIVEGMLALSGLVRGSFGTTYRRCGKSTCWCAEIKKRGHPCTRLVWVDETGAKTRSVREEDRQTVANAVEQYREFKQMRRQLGVEETKLEELLNNFERETTKNSRSKLGYL